MPDAFRKIQADIQHDFVGSVGTEYFDIVHGQHKDGAFDGDVFRLLRQSNIADVPHQIREGSELSGLDHETGLAPESIQKSDLAGELHLVRGIRRIGNLLAAFHLHNLHTGSVAAGDKHQIQMRDNWGLVVAGMNAHLMQKRYACCVKRLGNAALKPVSALHTQGSQKCIVRAWGCCCQCLRQVHLARHGSPQTVSRFADIGKTDILASITQTECRACMAGSL